jgi:2,4-dienoyl-CoA reductase-like NADH-dependent reductase (Old Yellow Enzyme family)
MHTTQSENAAFPLLMSPLAIKGATLKNRLVFQPHFTALGGLDGMPTDDLKAYHVERAMGGVGLILDGGMAVMPEGVMSRRFIRSWDENILPKYREITAEVHAHGALIFSQLTHGGHTSLENPPPTMWAPTQMPEPSSQHSTKAMDATDISRTIAAFGDSARNVVAAGFDGIEIKIAHDGLLRSFVSPFFNRRTDKYGGSFENRMRLALEVLEIVRASTPDDFPIGIRLCLDEYTEFGYGLDYGLKIAEYLETTGLVDYFNSDAGSFSSFWMEIPPAAVEQGFFRPLHHELKKVSDLPVVAFGRIKQPHVAERMLELGEADLIGMARQLIADPDTPRKILEGRPEEIRACIACNDGCIGRVVQEKGIRCVHNPGAGQELLLSERRLKQTERPRNVVVVGGGPSGMKVAEIAAKRGHSVTLLERGPVLGGQVRLAARQPKHEEIAEVTAYLEAAIARHGVEVWLDVEATADSLLELDADVLVIATGSEPNLPRSDADGVPTGDAVAFMAAGLVAAAEIPGFELPHVISVDDVLSGVPLPGTRGLVIDATGHWEGVGTAEYLVDRGCEIEVITARAIPGFGLEATNLALFLERAKAKKLKLSPYTAIQKLDSGGADVIETLTGEPRRISGIDFVVPAYPRRSRSDLYLDLEERLRGSDVQLVRIGDASSPRLLEGMMVEAQKLGMEL